MSDIETVFEYCGNGSDAFFSSTEGKYIRHIRELKKKYPEEIQILAEPETNDGCIYAKLPRGWLKILPPKRQTISEEERARRRDRMKAAREKRMAQFGGDENE